MANLVEVIVQPINLRFSLFKDEVYYIIGGSPEATFDQAELLMGVGPENRSSFIDCNLGYLPVCSTVLIRGEKTIIFDPNNHHIGFYGLLSKALALRNLSPEDIDCVVLSHWHHDHSANLSMFSGELVLGKNELDFGREVYGEEDIKAKIHKYRLITEIDSTYEICKGVSVLHTPGHTPGSISLLIHDEFGITAVMGDSIMTQSEWFNDDAFSHWYTPEQLQSLKEVKNTVTRMKPISIIPGHDRRFNCK